jgi:hypothetical protein
LRKVIDVGGKKSAFYAGASQLYRDIVLLDIERGTNVLRSILASGHADDVKYVAQLLAALPSAVVVNQAPLVAEILHAAQRLDSTTLERIESTLRGALIPSAWQSVVGEPDPKHVQAMEKAKAVARTLPEGSLERVLFEKVAAAIGRTIEEHVADDDDWLT